jgi:hypothetical protein
MTTSAASVNFFEAEEAIEKLTLALADKNLSLRNLRKN